MGKRRVIDSKIRTSQSFSALTYRQRDLWQGLIETADDQGRHPGVTAYIRSAVWPFDDVKLSEVEDDLLALELAGYIDRYEVDGMKYLQIIKWWHYQPMQWAGPSDYPAPIGWADRERYHGKGNEIMTNNWDGEGGYVLKEESKVAPKVDGKVASKLPREGEVKGEGEGDDSGEDEVDNLAAAAVYKVYEHEIGALTPIIADSINEAICEYPTEWIVAAMEESARSNARNWKYCEAILKRWKIEGFKAKRKNGNHPTESSGSVWDNI